VPLRTGLFRGRTALWTRLVWALFSLTHFTSAAAIDWPQLHFTKVADGLVRPLQITDAGDGSGRLFVAEQAGMIHVVYKGRLLPEPFLEMTNRVVLDSESGLLGIAFPPDYAHKKYFYAFYTRTPDGYLVLSRFRVAGNPNRVDKQTEERLLVLEHGSPFHHGGQIAFGPDGFLYVSIGDGLSPEMAQDASSVLGKILRIDVESGPETYAVPSSNPFVGVPGYRAEIWSLGLRNPWRFSFDRQTGDLYIGDVGEMAMEEIDFQPASAAGGRNYGWPIYEGTIDGVFRNSLKGTNLVAPVATYPNTSGAAVIGGFVARGPFPSRLNGIYVFGDAISGEVFGLCRDAGEWKMQSLGWAGFSMSSFGEDEVGRLYAADHGGGRIYRLEDSGRAAPPIFDPSGEYSYSETASIRCITPGAVIHYTTDGHIPTRFDPGVESGRGVPYSPGKMLLARAFREDLAPSTVSSNVYRKLQVGPIESRPVGRRSEPRERGDGSHSYARCNNGIFQPG